MKEILTSEVLKYLDDSFDETVKLIEEICKIPAPSGKEERRAEYVKNYMESFGAKGVYIDEALNVIYPVNCENKNQIVVFMAHTDTVFPDMTYPMPFSRDEKYLYSPGVGDDVACLATLLIIAKYVATHGLKTETGVLFVANSCEEGLGNLKGVKQLMKDYQGRVKEVYTLDGGYKHVVNKCVGSHRYKITFTTEGGHSFNNFGNRNAVYAMSLLINALYDCKVPVNGDSKTTYNVGLVEGGTSVNTIVQKASMLYEYRSDDEKCLKEMQEFFETQIDKAKAENKAEITVELLGVRPCGSKVDEKRLKEMTENVIAICEKHSGLPCEVESGSTDANIPMSLGIPAVCVGTYVGKGTHTREEAIEIASIPVGLKIAAELILSYFC